MQDRTINNALLALQRQGGAQGHMAEALLILRDVSIPAVHQSHPLKRSEAVRTILKALDDGPKTCGELGREIRTLRPLIGERTAYNRSYQALLRMEDKGLVRREGRLWGLAP